jgi:hypothetical protein
MENKIMNQSIEIWREMEEWKFSARLMEDDGDDDYD